MGTRSSTTVAKPKMTILLSTRRGTRPRPKAKPSLWGAAVATWTALGCGGNGANGFPVSGTGTTNDVDGSLSDGGSLVADSMMSASDGSPVFVGGGHGDLSGMYNCQPGTYLGSFTTKVGATDSGASIFNFNWDGCLSITLAPSDAGVTAAGVGENFGYQTLTVAPGAQLSGRDQMGGSFTLDLTGSLDCKPANGPPTLTGTLNGGYCFGTATCAPDAGLNVGGNLSATYGNMPPELTGDQAGDLTVCAITGDASCLFPGADGTWSAALASDAGTVPDCGP